MGLPPLVALPKMGSSLRRRDNKDKKKRGCKQGIINPIIRCIYLSILCCLSTTSNRTKHSLISRRIPSKARKWTFFICKLIKRKIQIKWRDFLYLYLIQIKKQKGVASLTFPPCHVLSA